MASEIRISGMIDESIVDGPGLRMTVFVQGCPHHCKGCHNPQTHDFDGGEVKSIMDIFESFKENPLLSGITFSGGEPFCQPRPLSRLGQLVKGKGQNVVTYTGYTYEQLLEMSKTDEGVKDLLEVTDILIDGPYVEEKRDLDLKYRGSSNQRIIILNKKLDKLPDLKYYNSNNY